MAVIKMLTARQVFDSRGNPTVEADILLEHGGFGRFITPSGASCGSKEARELRDQDETKFKGRGVSFALAHIHGEINKAVKERVFADQYELDRLLIELDGTANKSRLGANAILAVSGAFFHALADQKGLPLYALSDDLSPYVLPLPMVNVINGGAHANNGLDIQEFMIIPSGANSFSECMRMVAETFYSLKSILASLGMSTAVGDEGGFAPSLHSDEKALELLVTAIEKAGLDPGTDITLALDVAANELFDHESKRYRINGMTYEREDLLNWYSNLCSRFPIVSIEDPFHEDDVIGFSLMTKSLGNRLQIVGDDIFVTNERYIRQGIENHYANAVLIKMNQIGTISETLSATELVLSAGLNAIISHRSGDSEDTTIADLAVLTRCGQIKTGSLSRSERNAKYNRLLRIEEQLGSRAKFEPWCR